MALPRYVAEELGMRARGLLAPLPGHGRGPWDNGSCGSQTTFNSARAVLAAAVEVREQLLDAASERLEAARDDLELVGGAVRVKGSPEKSVTIARLAAAATFHGKGAGDRFPTRRRRRPRAASGASGSSRSTRRS